MQKKRVIEISSSMLDLDGKVIPITIRKPSSVEVACATCKYAAVDASDEPCLTCRDEEESYTLWE